MLAVINQIQTSDKYGDFLYVTRMVLIVLAFYLDAPWRHTFCHFHITMTTGILMFYALFVPVCFCWRRFETCVLSFVMTAYVLIYSYFYFNKQDSIVQLISFSVLSVVLRIITLQNLTPDTKEQEKNEVPLENNQINDDYSEHEAILNTIPEGVFIACPLEDPQQSSKSP